MKDSYMYSVLGMKIWIDWSKANSWIYFYLILNKNCKILLILGLRTGALVLGLRTSAHREKRSVQSMFMLLILVTSYTILYVTPCSFCVASPPPLFFQCQSLITSDVWVMVIKYISYNLLCYIILLMLTNEISLSQNLTCDPMFILCWFIPSFQCKYVISSGVWLYWW